jgi:hypothetical protein
MIRDLLDGSKTRTSCRSRTQPVPAKKGVGCLGQVVFETGTGCALYLRARPDPLPAALVLMIARAPV